MMIRPQQQRQKKQQEMIEALRVGDRIVTVGGFYGSVVAIKEYTFIIKIAEDVQVELQKNAIGQLAADDE
jgi:preprotein translocase subunit YajC